MQLLGVGLPEKHRLYLASDFHEGSSHQHTDGIEQLKEAVGSDPRGYLVLGGDFVEGATIDHPYYARDTEDPNSPTILKQFKNIAKRLRPVKKKVLVALVGNHDVRYLETFGNGVRDIVCDELEAHYGTYAVRMTVNNKRGELMYKCFFTHGHGSGGSKNPDPDMRVAVTKSSLQKALYPLAGDCALMCMGHTHRLIVREPSRELYLYDDGNKVRQGYTNAADVQRDRFIPRDLRWYVNTGCFYKQYVLGTHGYAEERGYPPNELGYAVVEVDGGVIQDVRRVILS